MKYFNEKLILKAFSDFDKGISIDVWERSDQVEGRVESE